MEILPTALGALWQVLVVGLLLGAGLPALFALGIRALAANSKPGPTAIAVASACFGLCVLAVLSGIAVIVYGQRLFGA